MTVKQVFEGWRVHSDGWIINPKGKFYRGHFKVNTNNRNGGNPKWYWCVKLRGRNPLFVHQLIADALVKNEYPDVCNEIDHINGDSLDNRVCNLRWCTHAINLINQKNNPQVVNSRTMGKRYVAEACGKRIGTYGTEEEARAVVKKFKDTREARLWEEVKKAQFAIDVAKQKDAFAFVD